MSRILRQQQVGEPPRRRGAAGKEIERQHAHRVQGVLRALRLGVEPADRLHGVAEQVEPYRRLLAGREEVQDAAAHRVIAHLVDQVGAPEAVPRQVGGEPFQGMVLAGPQGEHRRGERLRPRQPPEERPRRGHDGGGDPGAHAVERHRLLRPHLQRHLGLLVGSQRRRREIDRRLLAAVAFPAGTSCPGRAGAAREQPRRFQPGQRVGLARHHRHQRPPQVPGQQAAHPRRRRHRQAHHLGTAPQQGAIGRTATQRPGELLPHAIAHGWQVYRPPATPPPCRGAGFGGARGGRGGRRVSAGGAGAST